VIHPTPDKFKEFAMLTVSSLEKDDVIYVSLAGRMDGSPCCKSLIQTVKAHIEEGQRRFVLDLNEVSWMSSCGIGCLVSSYASVRRVDGSLALLSPNSRVESALTVTGLIPTVFEILESDKSARVASG
jgi:anti-anti-sigma factor